MSMTGIRSISEYAPPSGGRVSRGVRELEMRGIRGQLMSGLSGYSALGELRDRGSRVELGLTLTGGIDE
jgi:hypothetical protein